MRFPPLSGRGRPFLAAAGLVALLVPANFAAPVPGVSTPRRTVVVEVVRKTRPAVVNIHSERITHGEETASLTGNSNRVNGMGTGVVIDHRGYIVTNQHVVDDVSVLRVRLSDGETYNARVAARDPENDLALLKIDVPKPLQTIQLGTAGDLMEGEPVIAIGNAYGYEHSVTCGIVSATRRDVTLNKELSYRNLIQTDAAINPGNSGGPLLNVHGELIGVNVAIRAGAQNIGFAIPVDTMIRVAANLIGPKRRGGSAHGLIVKDEVDTCENPVTRTLVLAKPTADGSLKAGDVFKSVGDLPVTNSLDLERAFLDRPAGEKVAVVVKRGDEEIKATITVRGAERADVASLPETVWRKLGLKLAPVAGEAVTRVNPQLRGGMAVLDVNADSPAGKAGIQRGDVLIGLHQWETLSVDNVAFVLNHPELDTFNPLRFFLIRGGQVRRGWLERID